jgi:hypothetical protein
MRPTTGKIVPSASACLRMFTIAAFALSAAAAHAETQPETMKFAVMRNDTQIGTNTINVGRSGADTNVEIVTHISVGMAFLTLYKFDQTETEEWANGQLLALTAVTDDNGTLHKTSASNRDGSLVVDGDGQIQKAAASLVPLSLWNTAFLGQSVALNPQDGRIVPVSVVDRGEDDLVVAGRAERAHHYMIKSAYSEDVWYDADSRLIKVELRGSDGSTIRYELI